MSGNHRSRRRNAPQKIQRSGVTRGRNEVRIVGGRWRGRKIRFAADRGIRPSPDRVRETLFNWLAPVIQGASCLDLFAGSGVLGFEALSRGAATAVLVDHDPLVIRQLRAVTGELGATAAAVIEADATTLPGVPGRPFDIVFLDPPFTAALPPGLLAGLDQPGWLKPGACIYIERPAAEGEPALPPGWRRHRSGRAGDVGYYLAVRDGAPAALRSAGPPHT